MPDFLRSASEKPHPFSSGKLELARFSPFYLTTQGYHAAYNAKCILEVAVALEHLGDVAAANLWCDRAFDRQYFEEVYWAQKQRAVINETAKKGWRRNDAETGILERNQLEFVLDAVDFRHLRSSLTIVDIPGKIPGAIDLIELDSVTDAMLAGAHRTHAFVVGCHDHWITVVASRRAPLSNDLPALITGFDICLMESENKPTLSKMANTGRLQALSVFLGE